MQTTGFKTIVDSYLLLVSIQLYSYDSVREIVLVPYFLHHTDWSAAFFRDASTFGLTQSFSTSNHHVKMRCPRLSEVSWQVYCMCRAKGLGFAFLSPLFLSYWCGRIPTEVCRQVEEKYLKLTVVNVSVSSFLPRNVMYAVQTSLHCTVVPRVNLWGWPISHFLWQVFLFHIPGIKVQVS